MSNRFQPSQQWLSDWPHEQQTLVGVRATVPGPEAEQAVRAFLDGMVHNDDADAEPGTTSWYRGGYSAEVREPADQDGAWQVLVESAGEDGFDSAQQGADDLAEAAASVPDASIVWEEQPARDARG